MTVTRLIPNMLTLLALCAGATAIRFALSERWEAAVAAILLASVLDTLDGGMARLLKAGSRFGAELDSLADLVSFGIAPAVMLYAWSLHAAGGIGWSLTLLFCACAALRLARFNTAQSDDEPKPGGQRYFVGVPMPAAAGLILLPMLLSFQWPDAPFANVGLNGAMVIATSLLMVSRLPTYSLKSIRVTQTRVVPMLIFVCVLAGLAVDSLWSTLSVILLLYIVSIPVSVMTYRRTARNAAAHHVEDIEVDDVDDFDVDDGLAFDDDLEDEAEPASVHPITDFRGRR